jgi:hypothetical protein
VVFPFIRPLFGCSYEREFVNDLVLNGLVALATRSLVLIATPIRTRECVVLRKDTETHTADLAVQNLECDFLLHLPDPQRIPRRCDDPFSDLCNRDADLLGRFGSFGLEHRDLGKSVGLGWLCNVLLNLELLAEEFEEKGRQRR